MTLIDAIFWVTILVGGLGLALWYGASWRAVSTALAEAGRRSTVAPRTLRLPTARPVQAERSKVLV